MKLFHSMLLTITNKKNRMVRFSKKESFLVKSDKQQPGLRQSF